MARAAAMRAAGAAAARAGWPRAATASACCSCCRRRRSCSCFLTYPLGLGVWLGFTDARIGRDGIFIGLENYEYLWDDCVFWLSVFNTLLYTIVASILKFALGLWLALLLNENLPFKAFFRAIVLLPWVVPTVLSAHRLLVDLRRAVLDHLLGADRARAHRRTDQLPRRPDNARASVIAANVWRGIPFVAITLLAGLQTIPQSLYEAATLDGATPWQRFRFVTLPLLTPIIAIVMTFSVLFTFTDFQLIYVLTRGGPVNATHLMATLSLPARHFRRPARRGRGDRGRDDPVPARGDPVQLFRPAAPQLAAGRRRLTWPHRDRDRREALAAGRAGAPTKAAWSYLQRLPRRVVTVYLPLAIFVFVLLFPFYWMAITAVKPNHAADRLQRISARSGWSSRRSSTSTTCCSRPPIRAGCGTRSSISVGARPCCRWSPSVFAAYAIERLRFSGARGDRPADLPRLSRAALDPVHPAGGDGVQARPLRHAVRADPHLSDLPDPVLHLAADGLFPLDPLRARGMRADRRRHAAGRS